MQMDMEVYLKEAVRRIIENFNPEKIILFGSYAYGQPTADSDIDLMVIMNTEEKPHKRAVSLRKALKGIGIPKDIIVKTPEEFERFKDIVGTIIYPAAHKGKVLYERR
jgi:predicted nucleotidyltransferase